mgnify:CR=1 FL=1
MVRRVLVLLAALAIVASACGDSADSDTTTVAATEAPSTTAANTTTEATTTTTTTTIAPPEPIPVQAPEGFELVWSDEFDGDTINPDNWGYDIGGWGWGNGEAQYYTDRPENARLQNGLLLIEARQEKFENSFYTSARLLTQDLQEFQYGRIEARIKVPSGSGTWPAFWMLGANFGRDTENPDDSNWPNVGEIDIMEYVGREPDLVVGTVHGPGYAGAGGLTRWFRQEFDIADEFHTYAIEWDFDGIRWFFNDELYYDLPRDGVGNREWVFDQPFFIILNLAIGGTLGGTIDFGLEFPVQLYVDYVRVYQQIDEGG